MDFEMTAVFHYGKDNEKHIRRFQEKHLEYATRGLYNCSATELRALLEYSNQTDTLELKQAV